MVSTSRRNFIGGSLLGAGVASLGLVALSKYVATRGKQAVVSAMGPLAKPKPSAAHSPGARRLIKFALLAESTDAAFNRND